MSYTKKTWASGDTVTSSALNNIEGGIDNLQNFVVTLTPTAADYSGTMDKTVAEIYAAYQAGKKIVFHVLTIGSTMDAECNLVYTETSHDYPSFGGFIIEASSHMLIYFYNTVTDDGTKDTYSTSIYPLTPMT